MFNPFSFLSDDTAVSPDEVKRALDAKESVAILDVRTPEEYAQGHIKDSKLVPLQEIAQKVGSLGKKDQKMYVYCRSGARSAQAIAFLRQQGFTDVHNMSGGIMAWLHKQYPLL